MEWKWLWVLLLAFLLGGWCECKGCLEQEKTALLQLKPFFSHIEDLDNWVEGRESLDCCEWERIECNTSTGRVIRLFLNLSTTETRDDLIFDFIYGEEYSVFPTIRDENWYLNASLFLPFEELRSLYLGGNFIAGFVDNQGFERLSSKLDKLLILDLTKNYFNDSILSSLSEFLSLKSLYLAENKFTGSNPKDGFKRLSKMNKLETLDLHGNMLGNKILTHLGGFTSLKYLNLQSCGLKGTIDIRDFHNLMNLKELYLGDNEIESFGSLFKSKGQSNLTKLEVLDLTWNLFNNSTFSSLVGLPNLKVLYMNSYELKGSIPIKELNAFSNLEELYMSENEVNAFVPSQDNETELSLMNLKVLDLSGNFFNGSILSSLGRLSNLKSLSFDVYDLDASRDLRGLDALSNLEELVIICKSPEVTGTFCSLAVQSMGLLPSLKTLSLEGFSFNETMSTQRFFESKNFRNLEELDFHESSLQANLLQIFGELTSLKRLELFGSEINSGSLTPQEWQNLTSLEDLRIEGAFLPSDFLRDIGALTSLKNLEVSPGDVNGSLIIRGPLHFKNLESLSISASLENNFLQKIGTMPSLKFLDLWNCGLSGTLHTQGFCGLINLQSLDIDGNNLKGNLPECFSNFRSLENLDLSSNQFSGNISALESLISLGRLDLYSNQFSGNISALKSLKSLRKLSLPNNYFEIPITLEPLFNLSKLQYIDAGNNTINAGTETHSLAPTFQLKSISLSCCGEVESFPQFFYHQHDLRYVDLSSIYFKGVQLPTWFLKNYRKLASLSLSNSSLSGPLELPLVLLSGLSYLDISNNFFNGSIPTEIGAKLPSLRYLNMSINHFDGSIPVSIGDMNSLETLDLSNNNLTDGVPEQLLMGCPSLSALILSNNRMQGQMFSSNMNLINLKELQLDGNHFSGKIPDSLSNCSFLSKLDISNNRLFGEITRWVGNMSNLEKIVMANNRLEGEIPRWMGNMSNLEKIVMANNRLEGPIPTEFCQLNFNPDLLDISMNNIFGSLPSCFSPSRINQVHLSRNKLRGPLTNAFRNSTILVTLDLSHNHLTGNIPNWIGELSQLSYLLLNNNQFEGKIPLQLCNLGHLSLINLSHNNLSGTIPPCLNITTLNYISEDYIRYVATVTQSLGLSFNYSLVSLPTEEPIEFTTKSKSYSYKGRVLTYLSGIDLSCNKLTGEIPHSVKSFQKIPILNLSHNNLTGPIPQAISELRQIESLDLSYNNLSGKIPHELVGLSYLSFFSVAYNNLSGSTPQKTAQFSTFDESSYLGNPFLCGPPLPKNCSPSRPMPSKPKVSIVNGLIDIYVFYVSFFVSYVMVLLAIASVLYINPYWRRAWFYYIEASITSCYYFAEDYILPKQFHCGNM